MSLFPRLAEPDIYMAYAVLPKLASVGIRAEEPSLLMVKIEFEC